MQSIVFVSTSTNQGDSSFRLTRGNNQSLDDFLSRVKEAILLMPVPINEGEKK